MKKRLKVFRGLIALFIVAMLLLPVGVALAESFGHYSKVVIDAGRVIGDPYQRHTFIAEGLHWVFYSNDSQILYTSSADANTWATPTKFEDFECTDVVCCNGSVFSLWYDLAANSVDVAWMNVADGNQPIYYSRGTPVNDGKITWGMTQEAVPASANLTYSHPSICDNTLDYPFIAYMVYNSSDTSYSGSVSTSATNDSTWGTATNSTINSKTSLNISLDVLYPSIVPVSAGNISILVAFDGGAGVYSLAQNYLDYDVDTDLWDYPATAQFPLPATSYIDADVLNYHSEVGWSANLTNVDDVYIVAAANDSLIGKYFFFDRYGDPATPFEYDTSLGTGFYCGAIGIRNALGDMTVTAIEETQKVDLYSADYTEATQSWDGLAVIAGVDATSSFEVESDYDNAGTDYLGSTYYDNNVAFIPDLEYGCYGCTPVATPSAVPASVTAMAWIVILVFGALICLILLAYGASEAIKGGGTEFLKMALVGFITLIIASIIVAAML